MIRIGEEAFGVVEAKLTWVQVPDGTLEVELSARGERKKELASPHFRLHGVRVGGRSLDDLAGQVTVLESGARPDPSDPGADNLVAWLYVWDHLECRANRIQWGRLAATGLEVVWTGRVPDPVRYDAEAPTPSFEVRVSAVAEQRPFQTVGNRLTYANENEYGAVHSAMAEIVPALDADLVRRDWFAGRPFCALDVIVRVDAPRRKWGAPPKRLRDYAEGVVISVDAKLVKRATPAELRGALEQRIADALMRLETDHPGAAGPTFLK